MTELAKIGVMGKHPGYGDFVSAGLSQPVAEALTGWVDHTLFALREQMGDDWQAFWDSAQDLRFWIGRAVLGQTLLGVLRPSRDKVGRRYPLLLLAEGVGVPAPVETPDQVIWDGLTGHMDQMTPGQGGRALLDGLNMDLPADRDASSGPTVWAHHPAGDLAALLAAAAPVDASRAVLNRSYWWSPGGPGRAATWLGCPGLPEPQALAWALAGVAGQEAADEQ